MTLRRKCLKEQNSPLGSSAASSWMNISPGCFKKKSYRKQSVNTNLLMAQTTGRGTKAILGRAWLSTVRESLPEPQENSSNAEVNLIFISLPLAKLFILQIKLLKVSSGVVVLGSQIWVGNSPSFIHFSLLVAK